MLSPGRVGMLITQYIRDGPVSIWNRANADATEFRVFLIPLPLVNATIIRYIGAIFNLRRKRFSYGKLNYHRHGILYPR
jgi:hypothetical protein